MTLNRKIPPEIHSLERIEYPVPKHLKLDGGADFFMVDGGEQEVVKIDFAFRAGSWYSESKLESLMAASMLQEGTSRFTASEIANTFDFYGSQFHSQSHYDYNYITLLSLKKHLVNLLPTVYEIISDSSFPETEFEIVRQKRKKRAQIDAEKVGIISQRTFLRVMFSEEHPYAPVASPDSYEFVTLAKAKEHNRRYYSSERTTIIAAGHVDKEVESMISSIFGKSWGFPALEKKELHFENKNHQGEKIFIEKENANQNAISIGKSFPVKNHPDFPALQLLCTILGGYFGSRLMSNLWEDKGYTYSIHASPVSFVNEGLLLIFSEVKADKCEEAIKEIYHEISKICEEIISEKELKTVQNYMLGRILEDFDGPFARAQNFASLREFNLGYEYFDRLIRTIKTTTPQQLRDVAQKYISPDTMTCVVAGKK
jgi:predicted Zn-dependent peptidase